MRDTSAISHLVSVPFTCYSSKFFGFWGLKCIFFHIFFFLGFSQQKTAGCQNPVTGVLHSRCSAEPVGHVRHPTSYIRHLLPSPVYYSNFFLFRRPQPHFFSSPCHLFVLSFAGIAVCQLFNVFLFVYTHTAKIHIIFNPARKKCIFTENFSIYILLHLIINNKKGDLQKTLP